MMLFPGSSNPKLAREIAKSLEANPGTASILRYSDGEIGVKIDDSFLGRNVYVIQTGAPPINDMLMELLIMVDAFKRGGSRSVTAVVPYLPYSRKEKKDVRQDPISGRLVANLLETAGIDALIALDLHADALEGFFNVPVVNLSPVELFAERLGKLDLNNTVVVAPDMGGAKRARRLARALEVPVVILEKIRPHDSPESEIMTMIGDVSGKNAVIIDDIVSTGGTLVNAAALLRERGARDIHVCISHALFSDTAPQRIADSAIDRMYITDSLPLSDSVKIDKLEVVPIAGLIAEEIAALTNRP